MVGDPGLQDGPSVITWVLIKGYRRIPGRHSDGRYQRTRHPLGARQGASSPQSLREEAAVCVTSCPVWAAVLGTYCGSDRKPSHFPVDRVQPREGKDCLWQGTWESHGQGLL